MVMLFLEPQQMVLSTPNRYFLGKPSMSYVESLPLTVSDLLSTIKNGLNPVGTLAPSQQRQLCRSPTKHLVLITLTPYG